MADVLWLNSGPGNPRNSEGAFATLSDGRLIYIYSRYCGRDWHDDAQADLTARIGSPDGRYWDNEDLPVAEHGDALNVMSASLLRLQSGRILLFYVRKTAGSGGLPLCMPKMRFSDDDAERWSPESAITEIPGYYVIHNDRVLELKSGRIILPFSFHRLALNGIVGFFYSDDQGASFQESPGWIVPPQNNLNGFQEPGVVELQNGSLFCFMRTDMGCQYRSISDDQGKSWSAGEPWDDFLSPLAPLSIKRNPFTNALVAVWNDQSSRWGFPPHEYITPGWGAGNSAGRTPLVMAESYDDGQHWTHYRLLESDRKRGFCYTAIHFLPGAVLLGYCCGGKSDENMLQNSKLVRLENISA